LKPFQSYFSIYRTGQYHNPLASEAVAAMASNQQCPPQQEFGQNGQSSAAGAAVPVQLQQQQPQVQPHQHQSQRSPDKKYRIAKNPTNVACGNGNKLPNGNNSPVRNHRQPRQPPVQAAELQQPCIPNNEEPEKTPEPEPAVVNNEDSNSAAIREIGPLQTDVFGLYSLTFVNKTKDLSERKVRLDFSKFGEVARVRGQFNNAGEIIIVSFNEKESAEKAVTSPSLASKYGPSLNTCPFMDVVPDKDGHYSVEFVNSGMSGIREITNEFSKHGEVMKVMAGGGAKNAVKRVTVSFADRKAAFAAVNAHENSKDFVSIDFSRDCLASLSTKESTSTLSAAASTTSTTTTA